MYYQFEYDKDFLSLPLERDLKEELAKEVLPELLIQIRIYFKRDGINEAKLISKCQTLREKFVAMSGNRSEPTSRDKRRIIKLYKQIAPYLMISWELDIFRHRYLEYMPLRLREICDSMAFVFEYIDKYCRAKREQTLNERLYKIEEDYRKKHPKNKAPFEEPEEFVHEDMDPMKASTDNVPDEQVPGRSKESIKYTEYALPFGAASDFSHMRSFTPKTAFDMSALYTFLVNEGVIVDIDEKLFDDCISHAHVNELWEIAGKHRKRNLMQCLFKMLKQEWYPREWISTCASNMNVTVKKLTNPTASGETGRFEDELRRVLKAK